MTEREETRRICACLNRRMMCVMSQNPPRPGWSFDGAVSRVPFLRALDAGDVKRLRPYATFRTIPRGQPIWSRDDELSHYVFLVAGHAKLCRACETGRDVILDVCAPGELLCASAVANFSPACCACLAMDEDVTVVLLPRRDVLHMIEQSAPAAGALLHETIGRDMRLGRRIVELASGQVERRVAALLIRLANQIGVTDSAGHVQIPLRLSRQDLADLCGTTMETTIRTMTRLAREDIVHTGTLGPIITNRIRLDLLAGGGG